MPGNVLAAPGAIVIANVEPRTFDRWRLTVDVIQRDHTTVSGAIDFAAPAGFAPRTQAGRVRLTPDGWAAIDIETVDELAVDNNGVVVINVLGEGQPSGAIIGNGAMWLPEGVLLLSLEGETIIRRMADNGFGGSVDLAEDNQVPPTPVWNHGYVVEGDLSGLVGWEDEYGRPPYVTLGWDGSVNPRPAGRATYPAMGHERLAGASGAETEDRIACHFEDVCPLNWRRPNGKLLPIPGFPRASSWTRDGTGFVVSDSSYPAEFGGSNVALVEDESGLRVTPLGSVPEDWLHGSNYWVSGMSDWAAVMEWDDDEVMIIPLDGSPAIGPFNGRLAAVNP